MPIIRELVRQGYEIVTTSPDPEGIELDGSKLPHRQCEMHRSTTNPLRDVAYIAKLMTIFAKERPSLFLSFTIKPNIYGATVCRLRRVPAIPNVSGLGTTFLGSSALKRIVTAMYRFSFRSAAKVFFQNRDDSDLFIEARLIEPDQARIVPGSGVDLDHFAPAALPVATHFLMVSRLLGDKGVREYVAAARELKKRRPDASFSLIGELDSENPTAISSSEVEEWAREGVVRYLGSSDDVRPFIEEASAVVLPSYREGLPRTLLEAAAMARPLIAADVPGCREVVREGITGFLCKPRDKVSLVAAMERHAAASHDERSAMGARARAMAEQEYHEGLVVAAYMDAIGGLSLA
ncbi:MAG TPA: glycosyltransferase family 4 protein [Sphingomicrobium sp.]|nr:glycosyltransferase family 4 protein [Sphingomicrobium sp.]